MPLTLNVTGSSQAVELDFNKAAGIKAVNITNKFIGVDTKDKSFQSLFKGSPKIQQIFRGGYTEQFSRGFGIGRARIEASGELILARIYTKLGVLVESAGYNLGGMSVTSKQTGSFDLLAFTPTTGNGFTLSTKTISALTRGTPNLRVDLPEAYLKAKFLGDMDIGVLALDSQIKASLKGFGSKTIDLPRLSFVSGIKTKPPISIPLIDFSFQKVLDGKAKGLNGQSQKKQGILESEYAGIKITSDLRKFLSGLKVSGGIISGEFPIFTMSSSLNKLASNGFPQLKLLADRKQGNGYDIDYKLLDLSVNSDLKLKYSGKLNLTGQRSSVTFENGKSVNLSTNAQGFSDGIGLLNTTELKKLLDTNGDGKAVFRFDQVIDRANFDLDYGLYANLTGTIEAGKLKASVGGSINLGVKRFNINADLIDINLFKKKKLQLLKDFKISGGKKTISLPTSDFNFSKTVEFNVPTNADGLINILGLDPKAFYTVKGTNGNDNLVTRTEQGNDTFIGGTGNDTMAGGSGDDTYYLDNLKDLVIEKENAGIDLIIFEGIAPSTETNESFYVSDQYLTGVPDSVSLENYLNVEILDLRTVGDDVVAGSGNSLNNTIYASDRQSSILMGKGGDDILIGRSQENWLIGGEGNDTLLGNGGRTYFLLDQFDTTSVDIIKDFKDDDVISLRTAREEITYGGYIFSDDNINPYDFVLGTAATTSLATIIYDQNTGNLLADFDGTGSNQARVFAILENRPVTLDNIF